MTNRIEKSVLRQRILVNKVKNDKELATKEKTGKNLMTYRQNMLKL